MTFITKHVLLMKQAHFCLQNTAREDAEVQLGKFPFIFAAYMCSFGYTLFN